MNRRGFLGAMLTACSAPAIVRADSLMRIVPRGVSVLRVVDEVQFFESPIAMPSAANTAAIEEIRRTLVALGIWKEEFRA